MTGIRPTASTSRNPASGFSRLPPAAVADPLHEVLAGASEHLLSRAPASDRFLKLRKRITALRR